MPPFRYFGLEPFSLSWWVWVFVVSIGAVIATIVVENGTEIRNRPTYNVGQMTYKISIINKWRKNDNL